MFVSRVLPALCCLLLLGACSSAPSPSPSPTQSPTASPSSSPTGAVSDTLAGIKVTGKALEQPKVSFTKPFVIDKTRVEVLKPGTGPGAPAGGFVTVHYYGVNGRTGESFDSSFSRGAPATFGLGQVVAGFRIGLTGQQAGSRVLIAMPGSDGYDPSGGSPDGSIQVGDTLIFVVDVIAVSLSEPAGKVVNPPSGLPQVSPGTGKPTVTITGTAPAKMSATPLIVGTGKKVAAQDVIQVRYVGYSWQTGKLIDDGFDKPSSGTLASTIPGWQKGLVGKPVGSRVLLVLPPADGFPQGSNNPPVTAGDTVVYVVDLLFAYSEG